jgi:hypothetical protein
VAESLNAITMNFEEFKKSLSNSTPLSDSSTYLQSLWYDAKGNWNKAHEIIQNIEDLPAGRQGKNAAWIHAYLHRKEGDIGNADYWYRRADKRRPITSLEEEWENIVKTLL